MADVSYVIIESIIAIMCVIFIIIFCHKKLTQHRRNIRINNRAITQHMVTQNPDYDSEIEVSQDLTDIKVDNYIIYKVNSNEDIKECPICLENIEDTNILKFNCLHSFHEECIKEWWEKNKGDRFCLICNQLSDEIV